MTDPLLSTRSLLIKHDGAAFNRVEKTTLVARHAFALSALHVCWVNESAANCGTCPKCIRTMAALHLLGASASVPFPLPFNPQLLAALYIEKPQDEEFLEELRALAQTVGDEQMLRAADCALRRSRRLRPLIEAVERLRHVRFFWRCASPLRRWLVQ